MGGANSVEVQHLKIFVDLLNQLMKKPGNRELLYQIQSIINDPQTDVNIHEPISGQTMLHYAAMAGSPESVEMLLTKNAHPGVCDRFGLLAVDMLSDESLSPRAAALVQERIQGPTYAAKARSPFSITAHPPPSDDSGEWKQSENIQAVIVSGQQVRLVVKAPQCQFNHYVSAYRVGNKPTDLRPRIGSYIYYPSDHEQRKKPFISFSTRGFPAGRYRFLLNDGKTRKVYAASNIVIVRSDRFVKKQNEPPPPSSTATKVEKPQRPSLGFWGFLQAVVEKIPENANNELLFVHPRYRELAVAPYDVFLNETPTFFMFDLDLWQSQCVTMLKYDPNLRALKKALVPSKMTDGEFWKRFIYHLIRMPVEAPHIQQIQAETLVEEDVHDDVSGSLRRVNGAEDSDEEAKVPKDTEDSGGDVESKDTVQGHTVTESEAGTIGTEDLKTSVASETPVSLNDGVVEKSTVDGSVGGESAVGARGGGTDHDTSVVGEFIDTDLESDSAAAHSEIEADVPSAVSSEKVVDKGDKQTF